MTKHDNVSREGIMKATEFVKKFGWDEAKGLIAKHEKCYMPDVFDMWSDELQDFVLCTKYASFDMSELKRLVESYEIVEKLGGLDEVKRLPVQAPKKASHWGDLNKSYYSYDDFFGQWKQYWDIPNAPMWQTVFSMQFEGKLISLRTLKQAIADVEACHEVN